ncbi:MAG TPA: GNAT family N-acetyltransferase [Phenylobacterium sp.]|nr:GNAT family N-acetyltransferase [Phenylobacterium sp.]
MSEIRLRPCGPGDAPALALVGQATILETYAQVLPLADLLAHCSGQHGEALYADWLARPDHRLWLVQVAATGAPVGYMALTPPDLPVPAGPRDVELRRIYLLKPFHGGGLGARMMRTVIEAAEAAGFERLLLSVYSQNAQALDFYARQGFTQAGVQKFRVGANDYDDLVLARGLDPAG